MLAHLLARCKLICDFWNLCAEARGLCIRQDCMLLLSCCEGAQLVLLLLLLLLCQMLCGAAATADDNQSISEQSVLFM